MTVLRGDGLLPAAVPERRWPQAVGTSPAASGEGTAAPPRPRAAPPGRQRWPGHRAISARRRAVASSTTRRPPRSPTPAPPRRSRARPVPANGGAPCAPAGRLIRPAVDGATSSAAARSITGCGPREASTTRARYCATWCSSAACAQRPGRDRDHRPLACNTASTAACPPAVPPLTSPFYLHTAITVLRLYQLLHL